MDIKTLLDEDELDSRYNVNEKVVIVSSDARCSFQRHRNDERCKYRVSLSENIEKQIMVLESVINQKAFTHVF